MEVQEGLARVPWRTGALHLLSARAWNCFLMGFSATWPPPRPVRRPSGEILPAEVRANQSATQPQRTTLGPANATDLRLCSVDRPTLGGTRSRQGYRLIPKLPRARWNQRPPILSRLRKWLSVMRRGPLTPSGRFIYSSHIHSRLTPLK